MTKESFTDNEQGDMAALNRIEAAIKREGFTGGALLDAVKTQKEYVRNGGTL